MIKIALVSPSRGMVFSKMMESVLQNLRGYDYEVFMQHGISIPNCYNFALEAVVKSDCTHIWFVEEDHVFPNDTLKRMLEMNEPVVSTAYADRRSEVNLVQYQPNGEVIYTGMGCMLLQREVLNHLATPPFQTVFFELKKNFITKWITIIPHENMKSPGYGGQDVFLCASLLKAGYKINLLPNSKVGHMMLMEKGEDGTNNGKHIIKTVYLPVDENGNEIQGDNFDLCKSI